MITPRPDQAHQAHGGGPGGSRSGSGDLAGALGYPGVPPGVPNCQSAQSLRQGIGGAGTFFTFPAAGRIWTVLLSYTVVSGTGLAGPTPFAAFLEASLGPLTLAAVEVSLPASPAHDSGTCPVSYNGLPVVAGDSLTLVINGGVVVAGAQQEASAVVLYSIP